MFGWLGQKLSRLWSASLSAITSSRARPQGESLMSQLAELKLLTPSTVPVTVDEHASEVSEEVESVPEAGCCHCGFVIAQQEVYCAGCGGMVRFECPHCRNVIAVWNRFCSCCGTESNQVIADGRRQVSQARVCVRNACEQRSFGEAHDILNALERIDHPLVIDLLQWVDDWRQQLETAQAAITAFGEKRKSSIRSLLLDGDVETASSELQHLSRVVGDSDSEVLEFRNRVVDLTARIEDAEARRSVAHSQNESADFLVAAKDVVRLRPRDPDAAEWLAKAKAFRRKRVFMHLAIYLGIPVVMLGGFFIGASWMLGGNAAQPAIAVQTPRSFEDSGVPQPLAGEQLRFCLAEIPHFRESSPTSLLGDWELVSGWDEIYGGLSEFESFVMTVGKESYRIRRLSTGSVSESPSITPPIGWVGRMKGRKSRQVELMFCLDRKPGENDVVLGKWKLDKNSTVLFLTIVTTSDGVFRGTDRFFENGFPKRVFDDGEAATIPGVYLEKVIPRPERYRGLVLNPGPGGHIPDVISTTEWRRSSKK